MGTLDLKKLSKGMNIKDKMQLLFADSNRQAETLGKESILTPQERDAIIADARKSGEMKEIQRVYEFYRQSLFINMDMEVGQLALYLSISYLEKTLIGVMLKGAAEEIIGEMIYDLARQNTENEDEVNKRSVELRAKYKVDNVLFKGFDFFCSSEEDGSKEMVPNNVAPNKEIQKYFILSFHHAKRLKKKLFEMDYVLKKAAIDFLPKDSQELIKSSEEIILLFTNLDSTLKPLRVYKDYGKLFTKDSILYEPDFLNTIENISAALELTDEEKERLSVQIDKSVQDNL